MLNIKSQMVASARDRLRFFFFLGCVYLFFLDSVE